MNQKPPSFDALIQNYIHCLTTEGKSKKTIAWYSSNLKRFSQYLQSRDISQSIQKSFMSVSRLMS